MNDKHMKNMFLSQRINTEFEDSKSNMPRAPKSTKHYRKTRGEKGKIDCKEWREEAAMCKKCTKPSIQNKRGKGKIQCKS